MSSVLGHGLAGLAAYQALQRPARLPGGLGGVALALGLSLLPDLDVLGLMAWPGLIHHRGFSHSPLFLAGVAAALALALSRGRWRRLLRLWAGLFAVALVHLLLDYLVGRGPGVPWLWPWDHTGFLSPMEVLPGSYYARSLQGLVSLLDHGPTQHTMLLETLIFGPLLVLAMWLNHWLGRRRPWS
ncbi:MAG: metal-dependent hydrolase [Thermodesulfobacteriota bacterium]